MDLSLGIKWTCLWALSGLDLGIGVRKGLDRVSSGFVFGYQVHLSLGIKWTCSGTKWTCLWVPSGFVLGYEVDLSLGIKWTCVGCQVNLFPSGLQNNFGYQVNLCKNKSTSYPRTTLTGPDPLTQLIENTSYVLDTRIQYLSEKL